MLLNFKSLCNICFYRVYSEKLVYKKLLLPHYCLLFICPNAAVQYNLSEGNQEAILIFKKIRHLSNGNYAGRGLAKVQFISHELQVTARRCDIARTRRWYFWLDREAVPQSETVLLDFYVQGHHKSRMEENQNPEHLTNNPVKREESGSPCATTDKQVSVHDFMMRPKTRERVTRVHVSHSVVWKKKIEN